MKLLKIVEIYDFYKNIDNVIISKEWELWYKTAKEMSRFYELAPKYNFCFWFVLYKKITKNVKSKECKKMLKIFCKKICFIKNVNYGFAEINNLLGDIVYLTKN